MKTAISIIFAGMSALLISATLSFDSDPFNARANMHKITAMQPSVAYAASSANVMGYTASSHTEIEWGGSQSLPFDAVSSRLSSDSESLKALCEQPSEAMLNHPKFEKWCSS
jgi:hypothetical protein